MKIVNVVGARPNMMKMAPLLWEMEKVREIEAILIHTGQHYDDTLSQVFFRQLGIPSPDYQLAVGSGTHCYQVAQVMLKLECLFQDIRPDLVVVVGDVNSTLSTSLVANKLEIPLAHVEAGLRSFDRNMPEEINRILTDAMANLLFITEASGVENLRREGLSYFLNDGAPLVDDTQDQWIEPLKTVDLKTGRFGAFVGNVMIDTLLKVKDRAEQEANVEIPDRNFALLTLHRPSNVDNPTILSQITSALRQVAVNIPIIFPCHPRTLKRIREFSLESFFTPGTRSTMKSLDNGITLLEPLGYLDFLKLMAHTSLVLTDSGGIQEETTILGVPCLTLRENTERPVTLSEGTNILVGVDPGNILQEARNVINKKRGNSCRPVLWDGRAAQRIVKILEATGARR